MRRDREHRYSRPPAAAACDMTAIAKKSAGSAKRTLVKACAVCDKAAMTQSSDIAVVSARGTAPAYVASSPLLRLISRI
jgi:hypothetical protein